MAIAIPIAISFAVTAVTSIASYYLSLKKQEGARLDSLDSPTSTYGQPIPKIYGRVRVSGNLIWTRKLREEKKEANKAKGQPSEYTYFGSFAILLCEGVASVSKIWFNGKLVYDYYSPSGETQVATSKLGNYVKIYTGTPDQQPDPTIQSIEGVDKTPGFRGKAYLVFNNLPLKDWNNGLPSVSCEIVESENPLLGNIIKDLCVKSGIPESYIDVSELSERITGLVIENNGNTYRDILEQLAKVYFFYATEDRNGQIKFRKVKRPSTGVDIPLGEMGIREYGNARINNYTKTRLQTSELPTSLTINFRNPNLRFNNDSQIALTKLGQDSSNVSVDVNLSLFRTEARYAALVLLSQFWIRRHRYEDIVLPFKWVNAILPGDVIELALDSVNYATLQVESVTIGANYQLILKCVEYEGRSFQNPPVSVEEEVRYEYIGDASSYDNQAELILLDIPIFDNRNRQSSIYALVNASPTNWTQGSLYTSTDNITYNAADEISFPSAVGICTAGSLSPLKEEYIDYSSVLTVELNNANPNYQLSSATQLDFLNGINIALIGNELISFKNAVLVSQNTYTISGFLRGLRGTTTLNHLAQERFILLKGLTAATNVFVETEVGLPLYCKLKTPSQNLLDVPNVVFTNSGVEHQPFTPIKINHSYNDSAIRISWLRRSNYSNDPAFFTELKFKTLADATLRTVVTGSNVTEYDYTFDLVSFDFPVAEQFKIEIREYNGYRSSATISKIIDIVYSYIGDELDNILVDEDNNYLSE
jgi:hypothetical protein